MTTERQRIDIRGTPVEVVRKDIKNLHVGVYPPNGRVRVAAPLRLTDEAVRLAIVSRLGWIRRRQGEFRRQDRQEHREFVTGEGHYYVGRRYRLDLAEHDGPSSVKVLPNAKIEVRVRRGTNLAKCDAVLQGWYRERLREMVPSLVAKWEGRVGVKVSEVRIRRMKTRWGSCNSEARRIWLNLELAKKPQACLEYIVVHEMVHLVERHHTDRFKELMDRLMPRWRLRRDELNQAPLSHEDWQY